MLGMYIYIYIYCTYAYMYMYTNIYISIYHDILYMYGKCLGFARTRNDDRRRIIIIITISRIKPLLKIFNECRSLTGVGEWEN